MASQASATFPWVKLHNKLWKRLNL